MLHLVFSLLHNERDDRGVLKCEGESEHKCSEETRNGSTDTALVIGQGQRMVSNGDLNVLREYVVYQRLSCDGWKEKVAGWASCYRKRVERVNSVGSFHSWWQEEQTSLKSCLRFFDGQQVILIKICSKRISRVDTQWNLRSILAVENTSYSCKKGSIRRSNR